ncbi:patatin-like phospholipase family protein [Aquabacterium sp.]|uniref:patatin-like phospholipase family protein n=1 Tax=Aquabacterium sp. TaxID=1872578 RepID=UPI002CB576CB|nr:patatin-like phospholipase family protein [Aquabacterium sp.]HSW07050.1 patatin-like phospholipase family protein [Aquabacterium sp.]
MRGLLAAALAAALTLLAIAIPATAAEPAAQKSRPRIGLVLSGGGARGLAHVGVLKVLEEMQIPVDVIAATSMGAIVGGLYASGMRADELEHELLQVRWDEVFSPRIERRHLSQRRKEEDFEISPLIELGLRDGELRTPQGAVSSRGLESLLRRYTLPVRGVQSFDALPIAFRAVSTDMETGQAVVMDGGDLALALRSSMSVPGVFAPIEIDGHILGDGGLVNNTPVDVARALGADIVIVVNIGTPLSGRAALGSAVGLTQQMINILTEQNVQRSLATLKPADVLIAPELGTLSSSDFAEVRRLIALGMAGARGRSDKLAVLSTSAPDYAAWQQRHRARPLADTRLAFVRIEGTTHTNPERLEAMLESKAGEAFDAERAERDAKRLAGGGDYTRADYQLVHEATGDGLVFELEDKSWGPNYLRAGIDLSTDFRGRSAFNLKLSHNRHWLTRNGTEWRNRVQIGEVPLAFTELYHPLAWTSSRADDWFVAGYGGVERRRLLRYQADTGDESAIFRRDLGLSGIDLGQPWGEFGEFRLGWSHLRLRAVPEIVRADYPGRTETARWTEDGLRARAVIDQLDYPSFPQSGYRMESEIWWGRRRGDLSGNFTRVESQGMVARSFGADTFSIHGLLQIADQKQSLNVERYQLGGFHQLSGYQSGQLTGNDVMLLRLTWYRRLSQTPTLTRGFFVGGSFELGNAWARSGDIRLSDLRSGMSLFVGADTGMGPLYLGLTYAPGGSAGLVLFIGRP